MFRKLTERISSAANAALGDPKVQTLQSMGFNEEQAKTALAVTNGNVDRAAELLLASNAPEDVPTNQPVSQQHQQRQRQRQQQHDRDLERVMQESMQIEEERRKKKKAAAAASKAPSPPPTKSRAGAAALRRAEATGEAAGARTKKSVKTVLEAHHPAVKVPERFEHKSKEEQILRCADRIKGYPAAVDTLYRALVTLRNNPDNDKYRKIDQNSAGYKKTLEGAPGAENLLLAMNFEKRSASKELVMYRSRVDPALLYLGISALEGAKQSQEYKEGKQMIEFAKELKAIMMASNVSEQEALLRAAYMAKCPSEPPGSGGALMHLKLGDEVFRRRFDADDVLNDIVNWIGAHGSGIPAKLMKREWCLVDLNRNPVAPLDCEANLSKTLQYVGYWPSGRIEIRPSPEEWRVNGSVDVTMGSSRGLGAAPSSTLH